MLIGTLFFLYAVVYLSLSMIRLKLLKKQSNDSKMTHYHRYVLISLILFFVSVGSLSLQAWLIASARGIDAIEIGMNNPFSQYLAPLIILFEVVILVALFRHIERLDSLKNFKKTWDRHMHLYYPAFLNLFLMGALYLNALLFIDWLRHP